VELFVTKAPLAVLALLFLLYDAVGTLLLASMALRARPRLSNNIQGRLSFVGLAVQCFESEKRCEGPTKEIEDLFKENEVGVRD
jgi:hypothetical protein